MTTPALGIRMRAVFGLLAIVIVLSSGCAASGPNDDGQRWWQHVRVLAADSLRGRGTATGDYVRAARYVAAEMKRFGVAPAGDGGSDAVDPAAYFQSVGFTRRVLHENESSLTLLRDDGTIHLRLGEDANLSTSSDAQDSVAAPMMFVGYGLSVPEAGYDDLAGLDLNGKVAMFLRGGPDTLPGPLRASAQTTGIRWKTLRAHGAIGMASFTNPKTSDIPWAKATRSRLEPSLSLADSEFIETRGVQLSFRINPAHADTFLRGTGHTAAELFALSDKGRPLPAFEVPGRIVGRTRFEQSRVESPNVVGVIHGSDPALAHEYVIVSAHLDHLGIGPPTARGDSIYNGAMDNASGVASLLEFARFATQPGMTFRRSVILLAVTGEEEGLQGSRYFAARPTVPIDSIVADINVDMFLPLGPLHRVIVYGNHESDLGDAFAAIADRADVDVQDDPEPNRRVFTRSDQYSFIRRGVPSVMVDFGWEPETPSEKHHKDWIAKHYHDPTDDTSQHVNLEAAAAFNHLLFDFTRQVANADARPQWKRASYFRRYADTTRVAQR